MLVVAVRVWSVAAMVVRRDADPHFDRELADQPLGNDLSLVVVQVACGKGLCGISDVRNGLVSRQGDRRRHHAANSGRDGRGAASSMVADVDRSLQRIHLLDLTVLGFSIGTRTRQTPAPLPDKRSPVSSADPVSFELRP
jgi:hypothetical protein